MALLSAELNYKVKNIMKKKSNEIPAGLKKPTAPSKPPANKATLEGMAKVFNLWAERYAKDPSEFSDMLDGDGNPVSDYGDSCALYFDKLSREVGV